MAFGMCLFSLLLVIDGLSLCLTAPAPDCANTVFNVFTAGNKHVISSGNEENYNDGQTKQMVAFR